jgi:hypothetical protein
VAVVVALEELLKEALTVVQVVEPPTGLLSLLVVRVFLGRALLEGRSLTLAA